MGDQHMFSEPSGWLAVVISVCSLVVNIIQVRQSRTPRRYHRRMRVEHVRTLKVLGISYTTQRIERDHHHQA
jgi:hypothetical protein